MINSEKNQNLAARLEHANITVSDPQATSQLLCDLFGWHIRWQGDSIDGGTSVHVGGDQSYLAIYGPKSPATKPPKRSYNTIGGLNHVGVVVDDLDSVEQKVIAAGLTPTNHADYEPGKRFYFDDPDGIEYEVVRYG